MSIYKNGSTQRAKQAARTKKKLFKTAITLFSKYGFKEVTVDDIVTKAGVSKGTFYLYYASKEAVLLEQFREIESFYENLYDEIDGLPTASEKMLAVIDSMINYFIDVLGVQTVTVIYASHLTSSSSIHMLLDESRGIYKMLCEIAQEGLDNGEFPASFDKRSISRMLMRTARSVIYDWCASGGAIDVRKDAHGYFSLVLALIRSTLLDEKDPMWEFVRRSNRKIPEEIREKLDA